MMVSQPDAPLGATAAEDPGLNLAGRTSLDQEEPYRHLESPTMALQDTLGEGEPPLCQTAGAGQVEEGDWPSAGDASRKEGQGVEQAPPDPDQDEGYDDLNRTMLKMPNCPHHPDDAATELCPVCRQAYCGKCMTEKNGRDICLTCAKS
jgi:hypothetical protein